MKVFTELHVLNIVGKYQNQIRELEERIDELEQENTQLKGELEEYWHQEYIKEADDALVEQMQRVFIDV